MDEQKQLDSGRSANAINNPNSTILEELDFFNLFNLPKYSPADESSTLGQSLPESYEYLGFVPIIIQNTPFFNSDSDETDIDKGANIKIILPWKVHEISDTVSVSYSRRGEGNTLWGELVAQALNTIGWNDVAKIAIANYNAKDLNKSLDLEFILPLSNITNADAISKNFAQQVRSKLGALQGLVYPRGFGFLYPPLLKVTFGGLYRGFKGFLREVNIRSSEEMVDIGGQMFPLVITGSLRFVNVFLYTWQTGLEWSSFLQQFSLANKPHILFGEDASEKVKEISAASKTGQNNSSPSGIPGTSVEPYKLFDRYADKELSALDSALYDSLLTGFESYFPDFPNISAEDYDQEFMDLISSNYSDISTLFEEGQLECLGIGTDNASYSLADQIQDKLASIQDVSNYAQLLNDLDSGGVLNSLVSLMKICRSSNTDMYDMLGSAIEIYWAGTSILEELDVGLDYDNISYFYGNTLDLISGVEDISINDSDNKKVLMESVFSNTLRSEKVVDSGNLLNDYASSIMDSSEEMSVAAMLGIASTMLLSTEILKNMDKFTDSNTSIYEKSYELYLNESIDLSTYNKIKSMHECSKDIDIEYIENINSMLFSSLTTINGVI